MLNQDYCTARATPVTLLSYFNFKVQLDIRSVLLDVSFKFEVKFRGGFAAQGMYVAASSERARSGRAQHILLFQRM